ncbi:MFS transporter, DHA2 family, multidrug resistance protein [Rhizobiales bacterium GAS113]|nr:MFS transporter, DHA2 family, multidrug resistance protein [Rhizobiales bacterium GAS113]
MTEQTLPTIPSPPTSTGLPPLPVAIQMIGVITIAMVGSSISSQLVDLAIADVGGGFSVSSDQASWVACVATMAEVVGIPIAATLVRAVSLRTLVLWTAFGFALSALVSLQVGSEQELLVARALQSFCSGILSVLMFVTVVATLPAGPRRNIGLAAFGFASTAPTALNASVGAFVTERFGWEGLYYFDIAWAVVLLVFAWRIIRPVPPAMRLSEIDWIGYVAISIGLAALILFMKQGDRFFWLESPIIVRAGILAAVMVPIAVLMLLLRKHPLMDLLLLAKPTFGWAIVLATFYRFGLVMTAFVVPQALARLQGFRMPEIADANIWMFWAECVGFPIAWFWASRGDARLPLSLGLALFAVGAFLSTYLTPGWQAGDFRLTMIAIGLGQGLFLVPTVFYATRDVAPQQGTTAASLFNLSRVVGQTFGIAIIGSLITEREKFHSALLVDSLNDANPAFAERFNGLVATFLGANGDQPSAELQAWKSLSGTASSQAYVLAFADAFVLISLVLALSAILVLMLPPLRERAEKPRSSATPAQSRTDKPIASLGAT